MKSYKAWGDAYAHLFKLGCGLQDVQAMHLESAECVYRALYVPPFHAPYVVTVHLIGTLAELTYCAEDSAGHQEIDTSTQNHNWKWLSSGIDAFDNNSPVPDELPLTYRFNLERRDLTASQLNWFVNEMAAIRPLSIQSNTDPDDFNVRDGAFMRGTVRINGGATHTFDFRNMDDDNDNPDQMAYYRALFALAASVCKDESSIAKLVKAQRYFFGLEPAQTRPFAFDLIM